MLARLKSKWMLLLVTVFLLIGGYALFGFKAVPAIIRSQAMDYAKTELNKPLALGEITFNPFSFELRMHDIALQDQGNPLLSLKSLFVDFQASSLWKRALVFETVQLDKPFVRATIRPDGSLNLVELLPKERNDSPIPNIWVNNFSVQSGEVNFSDQSRERKPEKILTPITFALKDFKTRNDGGGFTLAAASEEGERYEWKGSASLQPIRSKGTFKVEGFKAVSAYEFLSEELPFQLSDGSFSLDGTYDFAMTTKQGMQLTANLPSIRADKLAIRPKSGAEDWIRLPAAVLSDTRIDLQKQSAAIAAISLQGLSAKAWLEPDGSLNVQRLFTDSQSAAEAPVNAANARPPVGGMDWTVSIAKLNVSEASIDLEDRTVKPSGKFQLSATEFSTSGLSLDLSKPLPIVVDATINGKGSLHVEGHVVPETVSADLAVALSGMPMNQLLMYTPDYPGYDFRSGTIAAKGRLVLDEKANLSYTGEAAVDDFRMVDAKNQSDFLSWRRVDLDGIDFRQSPMRVSIGAVRLDRPYMEIIVTPQQTINIVDMLGSDTAATQQSGAKDAALDTPIKVKKIQFQSGTMAFADYSIQPNFKAKVESLNGRVANVSADADAVADIDLTGYIINKYSPVEIKGKTSIFDVEKNTDMKLAFRNIELPVFNPYSGRFAGYAIAKGKLTTELHYTIQDKKLVADHHVILDQLTWGEATDSKEKVSLPIRLGTALLKDKNGVIDLSLPVTGTLDDPAFRIGPIVWQVIKNILVKAVSAPFKILGSLFAGSEQAQFVDFEPGSSNLSEAASKNLSELAKAFVDKPELNLDIPAGVLAELDSAALAEHHLQTAMLATGKPGKAPASTDDWETKQQLDALETLYKKQFGKKPEIPKAEAAPAPEVSGWQAKRAAKKSTEVVWLESQLLPKYQPSNAELAALGKARGDAVQDALLKDGTLAATRVFLNANVPLQAHEGKVRMELQMK